MRTAGTLHRRLVVGVIVLVTLGVSGAVVLTGSRHSGPGRPSTALRPAVGHPRSGSGTIRNPTPGPTTRLARPIAPSPLRQVPQTALQRQIDGELAQAETPAAIAAAQQTAVPSPAVSSAYPGVPTSDRDAPSAYAVAFATELLDTNFALQSRNALLSWAQHEEAPNTLPGVPAAVAAKALVLSLADPDLPGGSPSPLPSAPQWGADASAGVSQSVGNVQAEVDPDWTQLVSEGWQARDPRLTIETVTGTLTVATNGVASAPPETFSLTVTLGSAAHVRAAYGAVAAANWVLG